MAAHDIEKSIVVNRKIYEGRSTENSVASALMESKKTKHPIGARIKRRREEIGVSQTDLAEATGYTQTNISDIEAGKVKRPGKLRELAKALRTTDEWLLSGTGAKEVDSFDQSALPQIVDGVRPIGGILEIDVRAGMGGGGIIEGREVRHDGNYADPVKPESWHLPSTFVREELRVPENQIIVIESAGDSMWPTIASGERLLINTSRKAPSPDGLYALRDRFGAIIVKRLHLMKTGEPPRVKIISDNKNHPEEEVGLDEIEIVGAVIWGLKRY